MYDTLCIVAGDTQPCVSDLGVLEEVFACGSWLG